MAMTLTSAKTEIAKVIGGQNDANVIALAATAVLAVAEKWSRMRWRYLRKDNSQTRTLTGTVGGSPFTTVTLSSTSGINVGQSVTVTDSLAAVTTTTVASITSATVIVLTAGATAAGSASLVFAAYIPVIAGTDIYYAPHDYASGYSMRLLTSEQTLSYVEPREVDRKVPNQTTQGFPGAYTDDGYGTGTGFDAADQRHRLRIIGVPSTTENAKLTYYRNIDGTASTIDVPNELLYMFLDDCKCWLLAQKNANDPRLEVMMALIARQIKQALSDDKESSEDADVRLISEYELMQYRTFNHTLDQYPG